jgi:hypothetical protein
MPNAFRTPEHNEKIRQAHLARGVGKSPTKICPRCKKELPRSDYQIRPNGMTDSYCRPCDREYGCERQRKYWAAHPEMRPHQKATNRRVTLKRYHGITVEAYATMLAAQGGVCAICKGPPTRDRENLDVDHCHSSATLRGLLCSHCNRSLGLMGDDPERLRAAAAYLDAHRIASLVK